MDEPRTDLWWAFTEIQVPDARWEYLNVQWTMGYMAGGTHIEDPKTYKDRGVFFAGTVHHITVHNMMLDHTYTLEIFIKNYLLPKEEGTLYSTYRVPSEEYIPHTSLFTYSLQDEQIVFRDQSDDIFFKTSEKIVPYRTWTFL
jgi:hypothetical protein